MNEQSGEIEAMTSAVFFWYVFPLIVAAAGLCWLWYDKRYNSRDIRPDD
ncbi:hypothetical protein [Brucella endophytica]|nr:hypothetical protein [Brucella endophytica]